MVVHVVIRVGRGGVAVDEVPGGGEVVEGGDGGQHGPDEGEDLHGAVRVGADQVRYAGEDVRHQHRRHRGQVQHLQLGFSGSVQLIK